MVDEHGRASQIELLGADVGPARQVAGSDGTPIHPPGGIGCRSDGAGGRKGKGGRRWICGRRSVLRDGADRSSSLWITSTRARCPLLAVGPPTWASSSLRECRFPPGSA